MPSISILDSTIYYEETGVGTPIVFLHGNPTTSYLWRNITPALPGYRRLAPDLIGMGRSGRPPLEYSFADQARYLDAWFDALELTGVILAGHDWGGTLALDWAARHPERVRGIAFMETMLRPMHWADFPPEVAERFRALKTEGLGENIVLQGNTFIEQTLQATVLSGLSGEDLHAYTQSYTTPESRRAVLEWTRSMPVDGEPAAVIERMQHFNTWLADSVDVPKLLMAFEGPGKSLAIGADMIAWCRANYANLSVVNCGAAKHNAPEDQPEDIAQSLGKWLEQIGI